MNSRLPLWIMALGLSVTASAAPSADLVELVFKAADAGALAEVKQLVESAPELDAKNRSGETPLWLAAQRSRPVIVSFSLEKGADVNAEAEGQTALKAAHMNKGSRFLGRGAAEEEANPASKARRSNRDAIIRPLEEHGATK